MAEPKILGVREILSSFRSTLATARQTGEPVIIALRRRKPAGVLMGYETWQALKPQPFAEADTSVLRAELAAERQRNGELAARLGDAQRRVEDMGRDLTAARQRVAELEGQLARRQEAGHNGEAWGVEGLAEAARAMVYIPLSYMFGKSTGLADAAKFTKKKSED